MWKLEPDEIMIILEVASSSNQEKVYIVFYALDDEGQLRKMVVPFIKST